LTADRLQNLLTALPVKVARKIKQLSKQTGESVEAIIERAIDLYAKKAKPRVITGNDDLADLMRDAKNRALFEKFTVAMSQRAHASMTPQERAERAGKGAAARANSMTAERRKEIAIKASLAAKKKRDEKRKMAKVSGSSKP
jgi:hypothetical protein